jgi:hypothetical protein
MATKTTGLELKTFYADEQYWNPVIEGEQVELWHEELTLTVNGKKPDGEVAIESLADNDTVLLEYGSVLSAHPAGPTMSFETFFKTWRKKQDTAYLSITVPKGKLDAVKAAVKAAGGKIS